MPPSAANRRYSMAQHGHAENSAALDRGNYICKNASVQIWSPTFNKGISVMRLFPSRDPQTGVWEPSRYGSGELEFNDWIRRYPAVKGFGDPNATFIIADPSDPNGPDLNSLPPYVLWNAVDRAFRRGQEKPGWAKLKLRDGNNYPSLVRPTSLYFTQGIITQHGQKVYTPPKGFGPDDQPVVLMLAKTAGEALIRAVDEALAAGNDPMQIDGGQFAVFYSLEQGDPRVVQSQPTGFAAPARQQGAAERGFGCYLQPTFAYPGQKPFGAALTAAGMDQLAASKIQAWDQILYVPTPEEQARLMADRFPADMIMYAFADHPEWIPDGVRSRATQSHSVAMPGVAMPSGYPPNYQAGGFGVAPPVAPLPGVASAPGFYGAAQPQQPAAPPPAPVGFGGPPMGAYQPAPAPVAPAPQPGFSAPVSPVAPPPAQGFAPPPAPVQGFAPPPPAAGFAPPPVQAAPPQGFAPPPQNPAWVGQPNPAGVQPGVATQPPTGFAVPPVAPVIAPSSRGQTALEMAAALSQPQPQQ